MQTNPNICPHCGEDDLETVDEVQARLCMRCDRWQDGLDRCKPRMLFLDDQLNPSTVFAWGGERKYEVTVVRSYDDAIYAIRTHRKYDRWHLDHNLGRGTDGGTGMDVLVEAAGRFRAKWPIGQVDSHSGNYLNKQEMYAFIQATEAAWAVEQTEVRDASLAR